jgi:hypothetical protein
MAAFGSVLALGEGYEPGGAVGQQLAYMTRRSLLAEVYSQLYTAGPTAVGLLANGIEETGGIDNIGVNLQYQQMVNPYWGDYTGSFPAPQATVGIQPATWAYAMLMLPIPVYLSEVLLQDDQKIQDLVDVRMTDAGAAARDAISTLLWSNTTNYQQLMGVPWAIDDGTNNATWGNVPRATNTWWQSKRYNINASITRSLIFLYITGTSKYSGEKPVFAVAGPGTWAQAGQDFIPQERYIPTDSAVDQYQSAFTAFDIAGVPHFMDPYTPEGNIWYFNTNYISIRIHERCNWEFIPFQSMVPALQVNFTGVALLLFQMILTKPKSCSVLYNITGVPLL